MENSKVKDLTQGNIYSLMISFALPVFISQVFQQLYNTADTLIVGHFLGTEALAAVTSAGNLVFLMISFFTGLSMGAAIIVSKYFGAKEYDNVSKAIHTNILFGLISGSLLSLVGYICTPTFLRWMNLDTQVIPLAIDYYGIYFAGSLAVVMYNICCSILNSLGDSKRPLYYLIFSSVLNIILDTLFIAVFGFGVKSAAVATIISQACSVVLCLIHLCEKNQVYSLSFKKLRLNTTMLRQMVRYGLPSGVQNSVIGFANVIVQSQINSFGMIATAAFGAHAKIEGFAFLPINAFTMAITTFVSQNLGACESKRAKQGARFGILTSMILAELIGIIVFIFSPKLIGFFDSNPDVIAIGSRCQRTVTLFYFLLSFSHAIAAVCRGAGKAVVPMTIMLSVWCVFRICYIFTVMRLTGNINYIFWAYPITWFISSVIYLVYYLKSNWIHGFDTP